MCQCSCNPSSYVKHTSQTEIDFGYNPTSADYEKGYQTGINWDANWLPGGPFVYNCNDYNPKPEHVKMAADSKLAYNEWHAGFKVGLKARLADNAHFRRWWNTHSRESGTWKGNARYLAPINHSIIASAT